MTVCCTFSKKSEPHTTEKQRSNGTTRMGTTTGGSGVAVVIFFWRTINFRRITDIS